jgi:hypothetical protein
MKFLYQGLLPHDGIFIGFSKGKKIRQLLKHNKIHLIKCKEIGNLACNELILPQR